MIESKKSETKEPSNEPERSILKEEFIINNKSFLPNYKSQYSKKKKSYHEKFEKTNELFNEMGNNNSDVLTVSLTNFQYKQVPSKISNKSEDKNKLDASNKENEEMPLELFTLYKDLYAAKKQIEKMKVLPPKNDDFENIKQSIQLQHENVRNTLKTKYQIQNNIDSINNHDIIGSIYNALNAATEKLSMLKLDRNTKE